MEQLENEWVGKEYTAWYLNGGTFGGTPLENEPKKVEGTLINVIRPFIGHIMIEDENKAMYMIPFASIVLMELRDDTTPKKKNIVEVSLNELLEMAKERNISGALQQTKTKFKFDDGKMYIWNPVLKEWITPTITTNWHEHRYIVID